MGLDFRSNAGTPLDQQCLSWRDMVQQPISKLDDDAFTRVRIILMGALEAQAMRFSHSCARMERELRPVLAMVRRVEQHQAAAVNGLIGADHSPLEWTIAHQQMAIEVTAGVALREPDPYLAQVYRFGLLEDVDHLYRFSALLDRLEGKDANHILQNHTDINPGRPTSEAHRDPRDDLRRSYERSATTPLSKLHALTIGAAAQHTHALCMHIGPLFADPLARLLFTEVASIKEQHATNYGSIIDAGESWLEKWVLHEAAEVYCYHSCVLNEGNPRVRSLWEQFLDYELGHLQVAIEHFERLSGRDVAQILPGRTLPEPIPIASHRAQLRAMLASEIDLRANGSQFVDKADEPMRSLEYRLVVNADGSPSEHVAGGYRWRAGTELQALEAS